MTFSAFDDGGASCLAWATPTAANSVSARASRDGMRGALLPLTSPPSPDRQRLAGIVLRRQGEHIPFHGPMTWPLDAQRTLDEGLLPLQKVREGVILHVDRGAALG